MPWWSLKLPGTVNETVPAAESHMPNDLDELTRIFRELGADDPEAWAQSLVKEGNLHLHRFFALRQAWKLVGDENDDSWIEGILADGESNGMAIGRILERLLTLGVDRTEILDLVREKHYEALFSLCYLLGSRLDDEDEDTSHTTDLRTVRRA